MTDRGLQETKDESIFWNIPGLVCDRQKAKEIFVGKKRTGDSYHLLSNDVRVEDFGQKKHRKLHLHLHSATQRDPGTRHVSNISKTT